MNSPLDQLINQIASLIARRRLREHASEIKSRDSTLNRSASPTPPPGDPAKLEEPIFDVSEQSGGSSAPTVIPVDTGSQP